MLQRELSAKRLTFIKLPFVIKTFVLSVFEWPLKTVFTVKFIFLISHSKPMLWIIKKDGFTGTVLWRNQNKC